MTFDRRQQSRSQAISVAACAACILCLAPAPAQEPRSKLSAPEPIKRNETQVFKLKNALANEMATLLTTALGGASTGSTVSIVPDSRTNALIVSGPKEDVDKFNAFIAHLDQPGASTGPPPARLKVYNLGSIEPSESLKSALQMVLTGRTGNFAVDERRRVAIISADDVVHQSVEELLRALQGEGPRGPIVDVKVRVLWLVNGQKGEESAPLPDDLKEVLSSLAKLGIDRPRLAAQTLVNGTVGTQFQAQGVAQLVGAPCRVNVSGRLSVKGDTPALEISLNASQPGGRGAAEISLCELRTEITAPVGHFVVLGMTPMDSMTSVFVVQVLKPEGQGKRP
jgi:hypothetical protein